MARMTEAQAKVEAVRVAKLAIGRITAPNKRRIEHAVAEGAMIRVTFAGTGLPPFREARYTPKEVLDMIGPD
jgi:hypothetical protein